LRPEDAGEIRAGDREPASLPPPAAQEPGVRTCGDLRTPGRPRGAGCPSGPGRRTSAGRVGFRPTKLEPGPGAHRTLLNRGAPRGNLLRSPVGSGLRRRPRLRLPDREEAVPGPALTTTEKRS